MKDQIKSAIHCMRTSQDIEVCEECPIYGKVGTDHCFEDSCRIAEKSLQAWEEVLNELETEKNKSYENAGFNYMGLQRAINIINQKLSEIEEGEKNVKERKLRA